MKASTYDVSNVTSTTTGDRLSVVGAGEDLDTCSVFDVDHGNVLDQDVRDDIGDTIVLAEGTDRDAVTVHETMISPESLLALFYTHDPSQTRFSTSMFVVFGLKDTQSSPLMMTESRITKWSDR
jgi:hypothetical protein